MSKSIDDLFRSAAETQEIDAQFDQAYGRFMIAWADAEAYLYWTLVAYAGVTDAVARAIFSGARARQMQDHIKAIAHNTSMPADRLSDLEFVFSQLSAINKMRDHLAHFATDSYSYDPENPGRRIVSNRYRARKHGKEDAYAIDVSTLDAMTQDLYAIGNHLAAH